ncbi:hypothetical protein NDU88_007861 [Pleurodeles waltl]|uniref:Uncharacterized protein n=1 Tax=Pleurodeles waltl TaxID=8319 RepID=A0AAV7RU27_PLEWA|nr:hypothetical protein NDU88_007861 [Pleurodeles waltl]
MAFEVWGEPRNCFVVERAVGLAPAKGEGGKVASRSFSGSSSYSLRSTKRAKKSAVAEECETSQKQITAKNKEEQNNNNNKRKTTLNKPGTVSNKKVRVTPSLRTYFRVLPGAPRMPTSEERMQCEEGDSALVRSKDREASVGLNITGPADNSDHNPIMVQYSPPEVCPEKQGALGGGCGDRQGDAQLPCEEESLKIRLATPSQAC